MTPSQLQDGHVAAIAEGARASSQRAETNYSSLISSPRISIAWR